MNEQLELKLSNGTISYLCDICYACHQKRIKVCTCWHSNWLLGKLVHYSLTSSSLHCHFGHFHLQCKLINKLVFKPVFI